MSDEANGDPSIADMVGLVEQDRFEAALTMAGNLGAQPESSLFDAGRLAGLSWYCRYMLDDELDTDSLSRHVAEETRMEFLAGFGIQLSEIGALHLAEPVLERLTVVAPGDMRAWYNYGYILSKQEDWQRAIEALERAQALDAKLAFTHYELGRCYLQTGAPQQAAAAFEQFLSLEPDDVGALVFGGIAHSDAGQYDKATELLERAISVDPEGLSAYINLAIVADRTKDLVRLQDLQESVTRIAPDDWRASAIDAKVHELQGRLQDAWASMDDTFSRAVEAEDWASLDPTVETALGFAVRHGFEDRVDPWIENIFRHHCLARGTLHYLRVLTEPLLAEASSFRVLVEGRRPAEDEPPADNEPPDHEILGYYRTMWAFAETAEEAEALAMAFDRRLGGQPASAETLDSEEGITKVHRGVHWCAGRATYFPLDMEPGADA